MNAAALKKLDLQKYLHLLESLAPHVEGLFLMGPDGRVTNSARNDDAFAEQRLARLTADAWHHRDEGRFAITLRSAMAVSKELISEHGLPLGTLVARFGHLAEEQREVAFERVGNALGSIVACMSNELQLQQDLEELTGELIERYEELNLVYKTAEHAPEHYEAGHALQQLVRNCREHLKSDFAELLLLDKGVSFRANDPAMPLDRIGELSDALRGPLFDWVASTSQTLVLNALDDPVRAKLCPKLPYRMLLAPLSESRGPVVGVLALIKHPSRAEFDNSDRNLTSVMADKASKILFASHDSLTGLITRGGLEYRLAGALANAKRDGEPSGLLHVNIDQLHLVNDTLGRDAGDELIRQVATLLRNQSSEADVVARLGGDDFGVLVQHTTHEHVQFLADKLSKLVENTEFVIDGDEVNASISIGVSFISEDTDSIISALAEAEVACSAARDDGLNNVRVYRATNPKLAQRQEQMHWVGRVEQALRRNRFVLFGQLIAPLRSQLGGPHVEILLRMQDEDGQLLTPGHFMPAAERYHMMTAIDRWVIERTLALLNEQGDVDGIPELISINLSGQSIGDERFADQVVGLLTKYPQLHERLCFEVTETAAIANIEAAVNFMRTMKSYGCRFALDDFGAGLSSFAYLKSLPVDYIKIDGCFVRELLQDRVSQSIVAAINHVGHCLNLATVAEFVESEAIRTKLKDLGVDYAQGNGVQIPIPLARHLEDSKLARAAAAQ